MEHSPKGKLLVVSAPSGAGKTTLVKHLLATIDNLAFSISATSRPQRENETDGVDYYFLSVEEFKNKIKENAFLEWEEVYQNVYYGTLISEVERLTALGKHVVFDVDVVGGLNIKKHFGDKALSIFIQAPSIEVLAQRLRNRCTESEESIKIRIDKAAFEMQFANQFDLVSVNKDLDVARVEVANHVLNFIRKP